jgi:hypothetical protein
MATWAEAAATMDRIAAACNAGAEAGSNDMADALKPAVQAVLTARRHPFSTRTPSAPDTPPAAISGELAASMMNEAATEIGPATWQSKSGPTAAWSRIQELGGLMEAHSEKGMRWQQPPGVWHKSMAHDLPARPYLEPTASALADNGTFTDVAAAAIGAAIDAAV